MTTRLPTLKTSVGWLSGVGTGRFMPKSRTTSSGVVDVRIVFDSKESHDNYQDDPNHTRFVEENKPTWAKVRVFDSYV